MVREYVHVNAPLISVVRFLARVVVLVTTVSGRNLTLFFVVVIIQDTLKIK